MKTEIFDYDHQGRGIGKINNKIIFVKNAMIGEIVEVTIINEKKNYLEGSIKKFIKPSNIRCKDLCKYYNQCGGCHILHLPYSEQLKFKYNKVKNIINKYLKEDIKINNIVASDKQFNYRNKVKFQHKNNLIGFYNNKSNDIIKIDNCLLLDDLLNHEIKNIDKNNLTLRTNGKEVIKNNNDTLICNIGEYRFNVSLNSFFQINENVTYKLYNKILEYVNPNSNIILDLYCGTGTIGIFISKNAKKIIGIEINEDAIRDANLNKELNNSKNVEFICGDVDKAMKNIKDKPDTIIVDPPRSGLTKITIEQILKFNPDKIIYVSCDPMTLVRDLNILKENYKILEITPFDMFPNTYHVECVTLLEKIDD